MQGDINAGASAPLAALHGTDCHSACGNCGNSCRRREREVGLGKLLVHRLQCLGGEGAHVGDAIVGSRAQGARDLALGADDGDPGVAGLISVGVDVVRWLIENALMWLSPPAALDKDLSISSIA
jgi:hypothetical protein